MSEWTDLNDRILYDMELMNDPKYNTKYFVHRVIKFLRAHPERAHEWEDFVPDWKTRDIEINEIAIDNVFNGWKR